LFAHRRRFIVVPDDPKVEQMKSPFDRPRRTGDARSSAEAAFKAATTKPLEGPSKILSAPGARETVSLRIDKDVLEHFQEDGPGWQERINDALRKAAGK
jgi:uncharacterized protein (DUF4415 family)